MNTTEITDLRPITDFKGTTFSNYKQTDVKRELINCLINSNIEPSCYWGAEMVCSGHFSELWDILILFYSKYVHISNPKMSIYMEMRIEQFKGILHHGFVDNELALRNNAKIRHIFVELITILCLCKRKHTFQSVVIKNTDYDMVHMTNKMRAPSITFGKSVFMEEDPQELFIAVNELAYNITANVQDINYAYFWIEWIIEFERRCKRKKEKCECERRHKIQVHPKYQMDIIWIVWDVFMTEAKERSPLIPKIMKALLSIFCLRYSPGISRRRKYVLYCAIAIMCEQSLSQEDIIKESQKPILKNVVERMDIVYKQIKKNELVSKSNYLLHGLEKNANREQSIAKLNILYNNLNETI